MSGGHDLMLEDSARLLAALEVRSSQVHVEDMKQATLPQPDIRAKTASPLAPLHGNIKILSMVNGKTREQQVSIGAAPVPAVIAKSRVITQLLLGVLPLGTPVTLPCLQATSLRNNTSTAQ